MKFKRMTWRESNVRATQCAGDALALTAPVNQKGLGIRGGRQPPLTTTITIKIRDQPSIITTWERRRREETTEIMGVSMIVVYDNRYL
jgi:hypothetical protein